MGGHLFSLYSATQASRIRCLTANLPLSIRKYSKGKDDSSSGHGVEERAPSTAEEFRRVAEEKSRQGFAPSAAEKAHDAAVEATVGESTPQSVKEAYKESPGKGNFHKTGNDEQ